jgi:Queuosine biosynthesis protein QueC
MKKSCSIRIHIADGNSQTMRGETRCEIGRDLSFSTEGLESYLLAETRDETWDALLVAGAVEFADRIHRRPSLGWNRAISLRLPVRDPDRWSQPAVRESLRDSLDYLTGDSWEVSFYQRRTEVVRLGQPHLVCPQGITAVIPFSNGLDSRAVSGLLERELTSQVLRVRLSTGKQAVEGLSVNELFARVPYNLRGRFPESSGRSRGFKFAMLGGVAAHLSGASQIIVPESGQGALGPSLIPVGQTYEDYRSHPTFTSRMERFFEAFFERAIAFSFPSIWQTKGETLRNYIYHCGDVRWMDTRSCWQQSRQVSVGGKRRQCGVCAACMLRRMSIHSAGGGESNEHYVWENLGAPTFEAGVAPGFDERRVTRALREYAIAGALHLEHLAAWRRDSTAPSLEVHCHQLGQALALDRSIVREKLIRLLQKHEEEWAAFLSHLGPGSFVTRWVEEVRS